MIKNILAAIMGACIGFTLAIGGPDELEALLFPITGPTYGVVTKDRDGEICWTVSFKKLRKAEPTLFSWQIVDSKGKKYFIGHYTPEGFVYNSIETSKPGDDAVLNSCAKLPRNVTRPFKLTARARYHVWHSLWEVPRDIRPFY